MRRLLLALPLLATSLGCTAAATGPGARPVASGAPISAPRAAPAFELLPLGVLGGDDDANLSSYLLGQPGGAPELMIDAGAFSDGLALWKHAADPSARARASSALFGRLDAVLISHAHLDHVSGLLLATPLMLGAGRAGPLPLVGLPETLEALHAHGLAAPLWIDFTRLPPAAPVLSLAPLAPGSTQTLGHFTVQTVPLVHPVPSAGFLIRAGTAAYLHLGDTGPTAEIWRQGRALLERGQLRAVSVEVSFPDRKQALAVQTGHLTPSLLLEELAKLTGAPADPAALGQALGATKIIALHIKGADYDEVVSQLRTLEQRGLPLLIPERARPVSF